MYVTQFELADLRCFRGVHRVSLDRGDGSYAGWTVFAGRNGTGKSTLLQALALAVLGPQVAVQFGVHDSAWAGSESARVSCELSDAKPRNPQADLAFHWGPPGVLEWQVVADTPWFESSPSPPWRDGTKPGWFLAGFGPLRRLGGESTDLERFRKNPRLDAVLGLFFPDATLSDSVDWLKDIQMRALEQREGAMQLRDDVLAILNDDLLLGRDAGFVEKIDADGLWIRRDGISMVIDRVSDGYQIVVATVLELVRHLHRCYGELALARDDGHIVCPHPGVVLIDEIDAHMHVSWQQKIGFWLTSRFPNLQFLVTSHSPFVCQAASPRGILRLPAPGEDRKIEHVSDELFKSIVNGSIDDSVMSELFGLEHAHSDRAEAIRQRLAAVEARVLRGVASPEEFSAYEALRAQLPSGLGESARQRLRALREG